MRILKANYTGFFEISQMYFLCNLNCYRLLKNYQHLLMEGMVGLFVVYHLSLMELWMAYPHVSVQCSMIFCSILMLLQGLFLLLLVYAVISIIQYLMRDLEFIFLFTQPIGNCCFFVVWRDDGIWTDCELPCKQVWQLS